MSTNVLITGGSGYLGGTVLEQLRSGQSLPPHGHIYALVRSDVQAEKIKELYNVEPLRLNLKDQDEITRTLLEKQISVVFFLIDAFGAGTQLRFIQALAKVKKETGLPTHFLHTTGGKMFSSHTDHPNSQPLSDADKNLYNIQKSARAKVKIMQTPLNTNNNIIEAADAQGVKSYIFIPCMVYGEGTGFGNRKSIQTVAVVQAAEALGKVYKVDKERTVWPVSHVLDTASLYIELLRKIQDGDDLEYGKDGYYLASSGVVAWEDVYKALGQGLVKRGVINDATVHDLEDDTMQKLAKALDCGEEMVPVQMAGNCTLSADRGRNIGWRPRYPPEHILEAADAEVELILQSSK